MIIRRIVALVSLLAVCVCAASVTRYVDASNSDDPLEDGSAAHPFDRIQEAILASAGGDVVLVLPGTYFENIDFSGRDIRVESRDGPDVTTIDGGAIWSVVTIAGGETRAATLQGFSITNGYGGGTGTFDLGGGIRIFDAAPTIVGNRIFNNVASFGGGIDCDESSPLIVGNEIFNNTVNDNHLRHLSGDGGAISVFNSSAEIYANLIHHNHARRRGGGIVSQDSDIRTHEMNVVIANNLIYANTVQDQDGGGVCILDRGTVTLRGNTIAANDSAIGGGLLLRGEDLVVDFANTLVWNNTASVASQGLIDAFTTVDLSYSLIPGGLAGLDISQQAIVTVGGGILAAAPEFIDEDGLDFRLHACSAAVNAGRPDYTPQPGETDVAGGPRIVAGRIDIGAFETAITDANGNDIADACECPADLDADGDVGLQDLATLLANFGAPSGATPQMGDLDADTDVDLQDLSLLLAAFGQSC